MYFSAGKYDDGARIRSRREAVNGDAYATLYGNQSFIYGRRRMPRAAI